MVYLDYNATTPLHPLVCKKMQPFLDPNIETQPFGNASSTHEKGCSAKRAVEEARMHIANMLRMNRDSNDEIIFTSGGTESINYAIKGAALAQQMERGASHIVTSVIEHDAVLKTCQFLAERHQFRVTYVPVDSVGRIDLQELQRCVSNETALVTIMHSNNEVGTIQPIREIVACAKAVNPSIVVHTDASQSIGKVPVHVDELGVDLLTIAGHKLYAPKGIGALYIRAGTQLEKQMHGANQERGRRAGTENVMLIAGLGEACRLASEITPMALAKMRDRLLEQIRRQLAAQAPSCEFRLNGDHEKPEGCLPNTLSISFQNISASSLIAECRNDFDCSAGAACHSGDVSKEGNHRVSYVLRAMGVPLDFAMGTLRLSVGTSTTNNDIDTSAIALARAVAKLSS